MKKHIEYPQVSVVVPTFNRAVELRRCLNSLVLQTISDFEVLVCDDGSTDDTRNVVNEYVCKLDITYDYGENFGGPARPRNRGIKLARAPYIAFLDSDDWWLESKLEISLRYLNAGADVVFHDLWNVERYGQNSFSRRVVSNQPKPPVYDSMLCAGSSIPNSSVVARTEQLRLIGGVCEDMELIAVEDFDTLLRLSKVTDKFFRINQCLGYYWNGGGNISGASAKHIKRIEAVYARHIPELNSEARLKAQAILSYRIGRVAEMLDDDELALRHFKISINRNLGIEYKIKAILLVAKIHLKIMLKTRVKNHG